MKIYDHKFEQPKIGIKLVEDVFIWIRRQKNLTKINALWQRIFLQEWWLGNANARIKLSVSSTIFCSEFWTNSKDLKGSMLKGMVFHATILPCQLPTLSGEKQFGTNHSPDARSIVWPLDLQSSATTALTDRQQNPLRWVVKEKDILVTSLSSRQMKRDSRGDTSGCNVTSRVSLETPRDTSFKINWDFIYIILSSEVICTVW